MPIQPTLPTISRANHSNRGKDFESELEAVHEFYRRQGLVDMVKNPNEWKMIGKNPPKDRHSPTVAQNGTGYWMRMILSDCDFSGGGGTGNFIFDAKETSKNNFPFSMIRDHQVYRLKQSARCKVTAGVMIKFTTVSRVFFIPIEAFDKKYENWLKQSMVRAKNGTASLSLPECENIGVEIFRHRQNMLWDWLAVIGK